MYLKQLSIQGFKSFAHKTVLEFRPPLPTPIPYQEGDKERYAKGITAIIGPNGSGKSNIADSIRWVLGEQSLKLLRGKKSEDIIFGGSQKTSRLSRAEVTIIIDNSDRSADIEYEELMITRRLYRNGESEYLLNGAPAQLSVIQLLLSQAHIGQKNYAVIGQGMIDAVLVASSHDRKEFFDEATGVKPFQIKRDTAARKLIRTTQALEETHLLLHEIEPRLKLLERQVKRWHQREEIAMQLHALEQSYYGSMWHALHTELAQETNVAQELQTQLNHNIRTITALQKEFDALALAKPANFEDMQTKQRAIQRHINTLHEEKIRTEQQYEHQLETHGQGDIAWIHKRTQEIQALLTQAELTASQLNTEQKHTALLIKDDQEAETLITKKITHHKESMKRIETMLQAISPQELQQELHALIQEPDALVAETDHKTIKQKISAITERRKNAQELVSSQHELEQLFAQREHISQQLHTHYLEQNVTAQKLQLAKEQYEQLHHQLNALTTKLRLGEGQTPISAEKIRKQLHTTEAQLAELQKQELNIEQNISEMHKADQRRNTEMARLQAAIRDSSALNHEKEDMLHERRITIARIEQRKEDLIREMKQELGTERYTHVVETKYQGVLSNTAPLLPQIQRLRKQLEQIGEVDETIVSEHTETRDRFVFLSKQAKDLHSSINHLQHITRELDEKIETQFAQSFKHINQHFSHYFKTLFGGGKATLTYKKIEKPDDTAPQTLASERGRGRPPSSVIGEENVAVASHLLRKEDQPLLVADDGGVKWSGNALSSTEIQITASPPNKKVGNITALSGGERSLTAIALLCAIITSNPAPFIVLDEVDAALDEANSERFATILENLSHLTQFIAITHNRSTMHKAHLLYGVTMNEDASSRLFSVKLEEALGH